MSGQRRSTQSIANWPVHCWSSSYGGRPARGRVLLVHGLGEHGARYDELATYLTEFGFEVWAPDLPGHGIAASRPIESAENLVEGLAQFKDEWLKQERRHEQRWCLAAHSMGALVSLGWILRGKRSDQELPFAERAFLSAPPLGLKLDVPSWKRLASKQLERWHPDLKIPNGISASGLSHDAGIVAAYDQDPLVHRFATPRYFESQLRLADRVLSQPQNVEIPIALAAGLDDPIVDAARVESYFRQLKTEKKWIGVHGGRHEIFNEVGRRQLYQAFVEWFL